MDGAFCGDPYGLVGWQVYQPDVTREIWWRRSSSSNTRRRYPVTWVLGKCEGTVVVRVRWQRNVVNSGAVVFDIMLSGRNSSGVEEYVEVKRVRNSTGVFGVVEVIDVEVNSRWIREGGVIHGTVIRDRLVNSGVDLYTGDVWLLGVSLVCNVR